MSSQALEIRVKELEEQVKALASQLSSQQDEFMPTPQAAKLLGVTRITLIRQIKRAKAFPSESPFKYGIHWEEYAMFSPNSSEKQIRYRINPVAWREVCTKVR
jgi:predicted DNA-binding transcriptional regulator AlpA